MMENNLDQDIREKLQGREIQPSESAWERLSSQLDDAQKKRKKGWFLFMGYAASILLLLSLFLFLNKGDDKTEVQDHILVDQDVKVPEIDKTKDFKSLPVENEAIVKNETQDFQTGDKRQGTKDKRQQNVVKEKIAPKFKSPSQEPVIANQTIPEDIKVEVIDQKLKEFTRTEETIVANNESTIQKDSGRFSKKEGIYVDSEALLLSVTGTREDLRAFYQKYKVDRAAVLATIEEELKKSSLKIDPNTILAEVEKDVNEENFQNNFYRFIKKRVSDVATAIANRNN